MPEFSFDNTYARELPDFYTAWKPESSARPQLLYFNTELAQQLGLNLKMDNSAALAELFAGNRLPEGAEPIAQVYAGHQFGQFNSQLGDGRALILGEVIDRQGQRRDIAYKGSGRTPYSRGGDGKAAVGPMLREVLVSEAMHALGVSTTRSLAVVATGEPVYRERQLPGAVLTRVAASHIRIGTFEYFAARGQQEKVQRLADYSIARHYPKLTRADNPYLELLRAVSQRQADLIAQWMGLGFIHGVMNTDNMSIAGETIDYGPCAFMEAYDPNAVFSSIDHRGRYAYQNQPGIAQWNLARFAETLIPLVDKDQKNAIGLATEVIHNFADLYQQAWLTQMRSKLGLAEIKAHEARDKELIKDWLKLLQDQQVDFTLAWHSLADAVEGTAEQLKVLFAEPRALAIWLEQWQARCAIDGTDAESRTKSIRRTNPWVIPRNHQVETALAAASDEGDLSAFKRLLLVIQNPFEEREAAAEYAEPAAKDFTEEYQTFCGT